MLKARHPWPALKLFQLWHICTCRALNSACSRTLLWRLFFLYSQHSIVLVFPGRNFSIFNLIVVTHSLDIDISSTSKSPESAYHLMKNSNLTRQEKTSKIDDTNMPLTDINESLERNIPFRFASSIFWTASQCELMIKRWMFAEAEN